MQLHRWPRARRRNARLSVCNKSSSCFQLASGSMLVLNLFALILAQENYGRNLSRSEMGSRRTTNKEEDPLQMASIKLTRFYVPSQARAGESRRLICQYEIYGATLHAVKLFKDNKEFYRYLANDQKLAFQVAGIQIDLQRSNGKEIWIRLSQRSSGVYKCQVSVESTFNSVSAERRLDVVDTLTSANGSDWRFAPNESVWQQSGSKAIQKFDGQQASSSTQPVQQTVQQAPQMHAHSTASSTIGTDNHLMYLRMLINLVIIWAIPFQLQRNFKSQCSKRAIGANKA